jgi:hypothetical protein
MESLRSGPRLAAVFMNVADVRGSRGANVTPCLMSFAIFMGLSLLAGSASAGECGPIGVPIGNPGEALDGSTRLDSAVPPGPLLAVASSWALFPQSAIGARSGLSLPVR